MGQKIHPYVFRLGSQFTWKSRWFATGTEYRRLLMQDVQLRKFLHEKLRPAGLVDVDIERSIKKLLIRIYVSRPGVVIGRGGAGIAELRKQIDSLLKVSPKDAPVHVDLSVEEVKNPELSAHLMALRIADQIARRIPHQRVIRKVLDQVMASGALGIIVVISGRINGAEIGRRERFSTGSVPRQTIRADIDFSRYPIHTQSGYVGVKVWIHRPAPNA